jgi:hypothetical protein
MATRVALAVLQWKLPVVWSLVCPKQYDGDVRVEQSPGLEREGAYFAVGTCPGLAAWLAPGPHGYECFPRSCLPNFPVRQLNLHGNSLMGTIPDSITAITALQ